MSKSEIASSTVALQRCPEFVGRTTNWLYDHLRSVPRYRPVVFCSKLINREEFPALDAWSSDPNEFRRRIWHRFCKTSPFPTDRRRIKNLKPRVFHSHFGDQALEDLGLQKILDAPWIAAFYGADIYQLDSRIDIQVRYQRVFDKARFLLALGPVMMERLKALGCPAEKVKIHSLGVSVGALPSVPRLLKKNEPLRVLFAGTFREKKGVPYLLEAASILRARGVRLEISLVGDAADKAGDRETKEAIFGQIRRLGLEALVRHYSYLCFRDLIDLSIRSHVFVAPSITAADGDAEGTPFVLQQMMATSMAVVATVHSDIPYVFGKYAHLLVPERNALAIADKLESYAEMPDRLIAEGALLRKQICEAFDVRQCAAQLADLYDAVQ